jgi:peptide/nickel transport system substrate-binding protein
MLRRTFLAGLTGAVAAPRIGLGADRQVLRFVPQTDLTILDPIWTTAYVTRNHGYLVYDTLYGLDENFAARPQMVEGHTSENDGKLWQLTLRDGLKFHDGTPVLARDVIASITRWGKRDMFGQTVLDVADAIEAASDRVVQFRLKRPFPLLPQALGKSQTNMPCIMPERLALTDPAKQVTEVVGSGPYRFVASERVTGARVVYEKFDGYVPRQDRPSFTSGGKVAHIPRIEWTILPDQATAAAALAAGEVDWWEQATIDLQPMLRRDPNITVEILDRTGVIGDFRPNHLYPPFDNPAVRRAVLGAINQADCTAAVVGTDPALQRHPVGTFCPGTPLANDAGIEVLAGPRDYAKVKRDLNAAGYKGEKIVFLAAADLAAVNALCQVVADQLRKAGLEVDYQAVDWGTVQARRATKKPPAEGGWNLFVALAAGLDYFNPATHVPLRATGEKAWFGWPTAPKLEALRSAWFDAPDLDAQKAIAREIQLQAWQDVPYIPLGQYFQATAYRRTLGGIIQGGFPIFWNVNKS